MLCTRLWMLLDKSVNPSSILIPWLLIHDNFSDCYSKFRDYQFNFFLVLCKPARDLAMESSHSVRKTPCEVCYYITGHGLGHATRSLELIRVLLKSGHFNVHVVTQVHADFFWAGLKDYQLNGNAAGRFSHSCRALDSGASQSDVFTVDAMESLKQYSVKVNNHREDLVSFEVNWLKERSVGLVLVDATPLGCEIGRRAGAVTVLISNFSWDFCYREMMDIAFDQGQLTLDQHALYEAMVSQCEADSSACSYYLQLPGCTPPPRGFDVSKLVQGPLIARGQRKLLTRADMSLPSDAHILLVGFGGHSAAWSLRDSFLPPGWCCLVLGTARADAARGARASRFSRFLLLVCYPFVYRRQRR